MMKKEDNQLTEKTRAYKAKIQRDYRKRNPEKVRTRNLANYLLHKEERKKANSVYRIENKEILKEKKNKYNELNREKINISRKVSSKKAKLAALQAYGGFSPECECCKENDLNSLSIDHINGGGNNHRKSINVGCGYAFYVWLKKSGYPPGYRVLCLNCNSCLGAFGYCPHSGFRNPKTITKNIEYFNKIKKLVFEYYSNGHPKCECCGIEYEEFLCLDHINGNGNTHRRRYTNGKGGYSTYNWIIKNSFPSGFRLLCFRCNFKSWAYDECHHEKSTS